MYIRSNFSQKRNFYAYIIINLKLCKLNFLFNPNQFIRQLSFQKTLLKPAFETAKMC